MIHIDLPADLSFEDDEGLLLAKIPATGAPAPGSVLVAGTPVAWTWARVKDIDDGWVRFSQISAPEAAKHGSPVAG
ncbi:MAG: hypothetical protein JJD92_07065 [Frankiaceae bacterium]|nr:hypothetical protein [Frankiaceae bacterium]